MSIESGIIRAKLTYEDPSGPLPVKKPCSCGATVDESIDLRLLQLLVDVKDIRERASHKREGHKRAEIDARLACLAREIKKNKL